MDTQPQKKPEGDTSGARIILENMAKAQQLQMALQEQARRDQYQKIALVLSGTFLGGVVFGATLYGLFKCRGAANSNNSEYTSED